MKVSTIELSACVSINIHFDVTIADISVHLRYPIFMDPIYEQPAILGITMCN